MESGWGRVSLETTRREWAGLWNRLINSPSGMSRLTAMMSARWIMTWAMRRSCRPRILRSMVRSIAEKPTSSGVEASSTTCRSSRTDPGFHPNSVRIARVSQFSATGRATSPCGTTAGRLRVLRGLSWVGSESAISVHPLPIRIRIGNAELRQNLLLEGLHGLGVAVAFVIVTDQMQEAMHRQMAEMMIERLLLVIGLFSRRFVGDGDIAQHAWRIVGADRAGRRQGRERQHVGRLVDAAPVAVQRANSGVVGQHDSKFGFAYICIDHLGRDRDGTLDDRFGVGFGLPALGNDENLGDGKGKGRHRPGISFATGARLQRALGGRFWHQVLLVAGRCGNPS